jgi:hypothetical protein
MLQALSNHTMAVLSPGRCLDPTTGAWLSTSANQITWQSKTFIAQFVAEAVLGITNNNVNGDVDQIHASVQIQGSQVQGYSDAFYGNGTINGGSHYPRGVTTSLWWLNATNNPSFPLASNAPPTPAVFIAFAGDHQVLLLWDGVPVATGYNLKRASVTGGPYTPLTDDFAGASFVDSRLSNGVTYYYVLTATNHIGESAPSPEVSTTPVPSVGSMFSATRTVSGVTISWPADYIGWILQTNIAGLNKPAAWGDIPDSRTRSQMTLPIGAPNAPAEFFRLRHP